MVHSRQAEPHVMWCHGSLMHGVPTLTQAGNKSLLAYRSDIGVPGYAGYIPGPKSIVIPIKGTHEHTGKPATAADHEKAASRTVEQASKMSE